jgi:hypothetical protein
MMPDIEGEQWHKDMERASMVLRECGYTFLAKDLDQHREEMTSRLYDAWEESMGDDL